MERGYLHDGIFKLNVLAQVPKNNNKNNSSVYIVELCDVWHSKLGHVNYRSIERMVNLRLFPNFNIDTRHKCEVCVESKFARKLFLPVERNSELVYLIHSDVCDMKNTLTRGGKKYFVTFIDDCSKYCYVYLLDSKDKTLDIFITYKAEVENQLGKKLKVLRLDKDGEYESSSISEFCEVHGIIHQMTTPYTPQQNGVDESVVVLFVQ